MVGARAIIGDVVSPRQRGRYMGYFGAVFGLPSVIGPLAGGFITQHASWRWVFCSNLPIGVVALAVIALVLHLPGKRTDHAIDYLGTALLGGAITAVILLTTWGGTTYLGLGDDHRPCGRCRGADRAVRLGRTARRRAGHPARAVPELGVHGVELGRVHRRLRAIRRDHLHSAVPADRARRFADQLQAAAAPAGRSSLSSSAGGW
jgi:hypothetical protein